MVERSLLVPSRTCGDGASGRSFCSCASVAVWPLSSLVAGMVLIGGAAVRTGEGELQRCAVLRVTIPPAVNRAQPRRGLALPMPHDDAKLMS